MEKVFYPNGFLVKTSRIIFPENIVYSGVEGELCGCWPLSCGDRRNSKIAELNEYIEANFGFGDKGYVDLCPDPKYVKQYIELCTEYGIEVSLFFCETTVDTPQIGKDFAETIRLGSTFLGYDYAAQHYDYYSCVLSDILTGRIKELKCFHLNENGLFSEQKDVESFACKREYLITQNPGNFEGGDDYIFYRIWKLHDLSMVGSWTDGDLFNA